MTQCLHDAVALSATPSLLMIGDLVEGHGDAAPASAAEREAEWRRVAPDCRPWPAVDMARERPRLEVTGGYLERLPLACIKHGLVDQAEIWHHHRPGAEPRFSRPEPLLARRSLTADDRGRPTASQDMLGFIRAFGAPHILVVLGLGVDRAILDACADSLRIYNSIDAPALRVPEEISAGFDLVLTGAQWQSDVVEARHPGLPTAIMPIGPEFAATDLFRPLGMPKEFDLVYVAAAQPYKRHDLLFAALARLPRSIRTLCVFGYGELADDLRRRAAEEGLNVSFVGPPGVSFQEVNALMNRARIGVVCGVDDGAPAILTEYMLAGLPVLANAQLCCGRQFILPETGMLAEAGDFPAAIMNMLAHLDDYDPRQAVLDRWTWPHTMQRFASVLNRVRCQKPRPSAYRAAVHPPDPFTKLSITVRV